MATFSCQGGQQHLDLATAAGKHNSVVKTLNTSITCPSKAPRFHLTSNCFHMKSCQGNKEKLILIRHSEFVKNGCVWFDNFGKENRNTLDSGLSAQEV